MDKLPEAYAVRRLHPDSLAGSVDSLFKYLSGCFGGPPLYIRERGHPRLRMRHALRSAVERAFTGMADHVVNSDASHVATVGCAGRH